MKLHILQHEIKAPKGQFNSFGKYKYRSCEDIVEAVKPILNDHGFSLILNDSIELIGNRFYVKATATITNGTETYSATAYAREEETKKGMDGSQITGASSSYARKYALNGLFAIDDTKDADATNTHDKADKPAKVNSPDEGERSMLKQLVYDTDLTADEKERAMAAIDLCDNYETFQKIQYSLENRKLPIDQIPNPSQTDIKNHLRKTVK